MAPSDDKKFIAIANHFKSKGSAATPEDTDKGQGASNLARTAQAKSLLAFSNELQSSKGTDKVFLIGDFNSYAKEDPINVLTAAGYVNQDEKAKNADGSAKHSYLFGGLVGSLDHILASPGANAVVTGADIWNINSVESVALEYSRYNNNVTDYYAPDQFRASDHDPVVVGLDLPPPVTPASVELNFLGINDFHGRIDSNTVLFAGTIEKLRAAAAPGATAFLSAGDNIGASLFASAVAKDQPTIDVLNALELRTSAVGNHEFDGGWADLRDRVIAGGSNAKFPYLGANVYKKGTTEPVLPEYTVLDMNGVKVAVIGTVTQEVPSLVTPAGIADLEFGDPVEAINRVAAKIKAESSPTSSSWRTTTAPGPARPTAPLWSRKSPPAAPSPRWSPKPPPMWPRSSTATPTSSTPGTPRSWMPAASRRARPARSSRPATTASSSARSS